MGVMQWLGFGNDQTAPDTGEWFVESDSRQTVSVAGDNALRVIPIYGAVSLIADQLASLPIGIFTRVNGVSQRTTAPAWMSRPDPRLTWFDWVHQLAVSLLLRGNAYGYIVKDSTGIAQVRWLHPDDVTLDEAGIFPIYRVGRNAEESVERGGNILHIRAFTSPGTVRGLSPIGVFRARFETWMSAAEYGREWFNNSAQPTGILQNSKGTLTPAQMDEAKKRFKDSTRRREPVALSSDWTWQQVSVSPEEAQFLQTIKATATQIAVIFRVDPEDVGGESGSSMTYATRESNQQKFNTRTLLPWTVRMETALAELLPGETFIKFDLDSLARPNTLERLQANTEALKSGQRTLAEVRASEDLPALTPQDIADWQEWFVTMKSASDSSSSSTSIAKTI
jgi:HK97 family phage portal protein